MANTFRNVFRAFVFFCTFVLVLTALLQVTGRIGVLFVHHLEPQLNELLAERNVTVSGLRGNWRYLNPGIKIAKLSLPAGELHEVNVELDLLESALRGALILRRGFVQDATIAVVRTESGWTLAGMQGGGDFDTWPLLRHSDELGVDGHIVVLGGDNDRVAVHARSNSSGGAWRLRAQLRNEDCGQCVVDARYQLLDAVGWLRDRSVRGEVIANDFSVPSELLGGARLRLADVSGAWQDTPSNGAGRLNVQLHGLRFRESADVSAEAQLSIQRNLTGVHGVLDQLTATTDGAEAKLENVLLDFNEGRLSAYLAKAEVDAVSEFATRAVGNLQPAARWLAALNVKGQLSDVRAYIEFPALVSEDSVAQPAFRYGYIGRSDQVFMQGYKGAPTILGGSGHVMGTGRLVAFLVDAEDFELQFPDVFQDRWPFARAQASIHSWFGEEYLGFRSVDIEANAMGVAAEGAFGVSHPKHLVPGDEAEVEKGKRLTLLIRADATDVRTAKRIIPYKMNPKTVEWLHTAPRSGRITDIEFAYQAQMNNPPNAPTRRVEVTADVHQGVVKYHPDWPIAGPVSGELRVRGRHLYMAVDTGVSGPHDLSNSRVSVLDNGDRVRVETMVQTDARDAIAFVRETPLIDSATFLQPDWTAEGPLRISGPVIIPLRGQSSDVEVDLNLQMLGTSLSIPAYRAELTELRGEARYRLPHRLEASKVSGRLKGEAWLADVSFDPDRLFFDMQGELTSAAVIEMIGMRDPGLTSGRFTYTGRLTIPVGESNSESVRLHARSNLVGFVVDAPDGIGKPEEQAIPSNVHLQFADEHVVTDFEYGDIAGWLHIDEVPVRGSVGLGGPPANVSGLQEGVLFSGFLPSVRVEQWSGGGSEAFELPFAWTVQNLRAETLYLNDFAAPNTTVDVSHPEEGMQINLSGDALSGTVLIPDDGPLVLHFDTVVVPVEEDKATQDEAPSLADLAAASEDPLSLSVYDDIPEALVDIERLYLGSDDFGSWQFNITKPSDNELVFEDLSAHVKGVHIVSEQGVRWTAADNRSHFFGYLSTADLAEVLPQWDYAASIQSEESTIGANVTWPGSPLNVALLGLSGDASFRASTGRFLEVESGAGALRILSLLNFTAIIKRLNLNFKDVVGKGVSFEEMTANVRLEEGDLYFTQPMDIQSTASDFKVGGHVDLATGELNNEMVVTLPVNKGLPWYGVYVALANPLAGLGVLLGERVLRKPIRQMSSAKYLIRGNLDDPDVRFVELFSTAMRDLEELQEGAADVGQDLEPVGTEAVEAPIPEETVEPAVPVNGVPRGSTDKVPPAGVTGMIDEPQLEKQGAKQP